jgi:hypothetical protein
MDGQWLSSVAVLVALVAILARALGRSNRCPECRALFTVRTVEATSEGEKLVLRQQCGRCGCEWEVAAGH